LFTLSLFLFSTGYSQGVGINETGNAPHPSAMLDVSGTSSGVLINRMTESQRDAIQNPAYGLMILNTTTDCLNMWSGTFWKQLCWDCSFFVLPENSGPVCEGEMVNLKVTSLSDANYTWTGPNDFISNEQNPVITNASLSSSGDYFVTVSKDGCTSHPRST